MGELDALTIRNNAAREAWGYRVQATNYRQSASLTKMAAKNQASSIRNQGWTTLLTSGLQIGASMYGGGASAAQKYSSNYSGMQVVGGRPVFIPR
jgi:hypothetical protein